MSFATSGYEPDAWFSFDSAVQEFVDYDLFDWRVLGQACNQAFSIAWSDDA